jgi:hypothetical protein
MQLNAQSQWTEARDPVGMITEHQESESYYTDVNCSDGASVREIEPVDRRYHNRKPSRILSTTGLVALSN